MVSWNFLLYSSAFLELFPFTLKTCFWSKIFFQCSRIPKIFCCWCFASVIPLYSMNMYLMQVVFTHISREPPFEPKPSLYPVCEYLIKECIKRYAKETCPLCNERVLPQNPEVMNMAGTHIYYFFNFHFFLIKASTASNVFWCLYLWNRAHSCFD